MAPYTVEIVWTCTCGGKGAIPLIHQDDDRGRLKLLRMSHREAKGCWLSTEFRRLA